MRRMRSRGVERNKYQEFVRGQDILHFSLEQVQEFQVQVQEFLAGKSIFVRESLSLSKLNAQEKNP